MTAPKQGTSGNQDDGFKGAEDSLNAITAGNNQLQQQISSGQLVMSPHAATAAAKAYEHAASTIDHLINGARRLAHVDGLGAYDSAVQLAAKFGHKASNGMSGAADLLGQLSKELKRKADLFRQACQDYQSRDEHAADDLRRVSR